MVTLAFVPWLASLAAEPSAQGVQFRDVRVFDGRSTRLSVPGDDLGTPGVE